MPFLRSRLGRKATIAGSLSQQLAKVPDNVHVILVDIPEHCDVLAIVRYAEMRACMRQDSEFLGWEASTNSVERPGALWLAGNLHDAAIREPPDRDWIRACESCDPCKVAACDVHRRHDDRVSGSVQSMDK